MTIILLAAPMQLVAARAALHPLSHASTTVTSPQSGVVGGERRQGARLGLASWLRDQLSCGVADPDTPLSGTNCKFQGLLPPVGIPTPHLRGAAFYRKSGVPPGGGIPRAWPAERWTGTTSLNQTVEPVGLPSYKNCQKFWG